MTNIGALNFMNALELDGFAVFQIKDDKKGSGVRKKDLAGRYCDLEPRLAKLNNRGNAIFVQVQGGTDRGDKFIKQARWFYVDFDNASELPALPFKPHLVVKTPRGFHVYWRIRPTKKFDLWKRVEKKLVNFLDADPGVRSLSQVLRVPGFNHHKGEPIMIEIERWEDLHMADYRIEDFALHFNVSISNLSEQDRRDLKNFETVELSKEARRKFFPIVISTLEKQIDRISKAGKGSRHTTVRDAAFCLGHYYHWGLDLEIAYSRMMLEIERRGWPEPTRKQSAFRVLVRDGLKAGRLDGCPHASYDLQCQLNKIEKGDQVRAKIFQMACDWPDRITTRKAKELLVSEGLREVWSSEQQSSYQIGKGLVCSGYQRAGRSNGETVYQRVPEGATSNPS